MKNFLLILFLVFRAAFISAQEKKLDSLKNIYSSKISSVIKTNPTAIVIGNLPMPALTSEYRLLYELVNGQKQSLQLGVSYFGKGMIIRYLEKDTLKKNPSAVIPEYYFTGFRIQGAYKFFCNDWIYTLGLSDAPIYAPKGFYISPHVSFATVKLSAKGLPSDYIRANAFSASLIFGCQIILFKKFAADVFAGMGYKQIQWFRHRMGVVKQINLKTDRDFKDYAEGIPNYLSPLKITLGINFGIASK